MVFVGRPDVEGVAGEIVQGDVCGSVRGRRGYASERDDRHGDDGEDAAEDPQLPGCPTAKRMS